MAYVTVDELEKLGQAYSVRKGMFKLGEAVDQSNVFLAHSSKDKDSLVKGAIQVLEQHGGGVYVDSNDKILPQSTNKTTAEVLRHRIRSLPRFVVLVSENSKDSRWVPWELGLADGLKKPDTLAVLPTVQYDPNWPEQEYLSLYPRLGQWRVGQGPLEWLVLVNETRYWRLRDWLQGD